MTLEAARAEDGRARDSQPGREGDGIAHPNVDLLNQGYDAFEKGDLETIRGLFTDDVVFHVPGRSKLAGDKRGNDEVLGFFGELVQLSDGTFKIDRHAVIADDEHGAVLSTTSAQRGDASFSVKTVDTFHFRDGKVSECWSFAEDPYALDEFWG